MRRSQSLLLSVALGIILALVGAMGLAVVLG